MVSRGAWSLLKTKLRCRDATNLPSWACLDGTNAAQATDAGITQIKWSPLPIFLASNGWLCCLFLKLISVFKHQLQIHWNNSTQCEYTQMYEHCVKFVEHDYHSEEKVKREKFLKSTWNKKFKQGPNELPREVDRTRARLCQIYSHIPKGHRNGTYNVKGVAICPAEFGSGSTNPEDDKRETKFSVDWL